MYQWGLLASQAPTVAYLDPYLATRSCTSIDV